MRLAISKSFFLVAMTMALVTGANDAAQAYPEMSAGARNALAADGDQQYLAQFPGRRNRLDLDDDDFDDLRDAIEDRRDDRDFGPRRPRRGRRDPWRRLDLDDDDFDDLRDAIEDRRDDRDFGPRRR